MKAWMKLPVGSEPTKMLVGFDQQDAVTVPREKRGADQSVVSGSDDYGVVLAHGGTVYRNVGGL